MATCILERLNEEAAAVVPSTAASGRRVAGPRIHAWASELDEPVQVLRAGGDVIAIGTDMEARCFDAMSGQVLWSGLLLRGRWRLLDATREVMVVAEREARDRVPP
jgi:hypothetical protein